MRIILSGGRWRKPVQVTGPAVPRVGWAGPHRIKNLPLLRGVGEQNWSPRSCTCSWQPKIYCQNTFKNKVNGCQKRPDSWAVASGRWMGSGQLREEVTTAPLDSRAPSVSASVPPFAEPNRSALLPNIPSLPHPSAYSPVCQPFCYLETVFVLLWIVFFFFFSRRNPPTAFFLREAECPQGVTVQRGLGDIVLSNHPRVLRGESPCLGEGT